MRVTFFLAILISLLLRPAANQQQCAVSFSAGEGIYGQLGNNCAFDQFPLNEPPYRSDLTCNRNQYVQVTGALAGYCIRQIATGVGFTLWLTTTGELFSAGSNSYGQLGLGPTVRGVSNPTRIDTSAISLLDGNPVITSIAVGDDWSFAITDNGLLFSWGRNDAGQNGNLQPGPQHNPTIFAQAAQGVRVAGVDGGTDHSIFWTTEGRVWGTGVNEFGQVGQPSLHVQYRGWIQITNGDPQPLNSTRVIGGAAGYQWNVLFTDTGRVWVFGNGVSGTLGTGDVRQSVSTPLMIPPNVIQNVVRVSAGYRFTAAIAEPSPGVRSLWFWGEGSSYALCNNSLRDIDVLRPQVLSTFTNVQSVWTGKYATLFTLSTGAIYMCGKNEEGQLGTGSFTPLFDSTLRDPNTFPGTPISFDGSDGGFTVIVAAGRGTVTPTAPVAVPAAVTRVPATPTPNPTYQPTPPPVLVTEPPTNPTPPTMNPTPRPTNPPTTPPPVLTFAPVSITPAPAEPMNPIIPTTEAPVEPVTPDSPTTHVPVEPVNPVAPTSATPTQPAAPADTPAPTAASPTITSAPRAASPTITSAPRAPTTVPSTNTRSPNAPDVDPPNSAPRSIYSFAMALFALVALLFF